MFRQLPVTGLLLLTFAVIPAAAQGWSYTDSTGNTVTLEQVPDRIIASQDAAAGLIPLGIRPVGIFADSAIAEAKALQGLDLTGIEIIGQTWGEVDIEKAAALEPDLVIAEYWPMDKTWSGGADATAALQALVPVTGPTQGNSIISLIEDYEALATSLGADLDRPEIASAKTQFQSALDRFKAAVTDKPGLDALAVWAGPDGLYVAAVEGSAELTDFKSWGLNLISPEMADDRGYWETLSWENADKYQPDLVLVDNRSETTLQAAQAQPTWTLIRAAAAGQVADWPAFWLRNYAAYTGALDELTAAIQAADENLGD